MKLLDGLGFRLAAFFQRSGMNSELEEELRSHIQHRADDLERSGLDRAQAERRARIEFGGRERFAFVDLLLGIGRQSHVADL